MKIAHINCTYRNGSTGKITYELHNFLLKHGIESVVLFSDGTSSDCGTKKYMNRFEQLLFSLRSHVFGDYGFEGAVAARRIIRFLKRYKPDIVQIHNLHSHNGSLSLLMKYLSRSEINVCYSIHDCWPFTGYCPHFASLGCTKWKTECGRCPVYRRYSFFIDRSTSNFRKKKAALSTYQKLYLIFGSNWIKEIASNSFLSDRKAIVIPYGIDHTIFRPKENEHFKSLFPADKINVIGVAYNFTKEKGLLDFVELSQRAKDGINVILVGNISDDCPLPKNITCIPRQENQELLAELFSSADIFVNLTKEETFGLTNVEALGCGTPVVTYASGGSPEALDSSCGAVVECGRLDEVIHSIERFGKKKHEISINCVNRASLFSNEKMCENYLRFYEKIEMRDQQSFENSPHPKEPIV